MNDTKQLQGLQQKAKNMSYLFVYGLPITLAGIGYLLYKFMS